MKKLLLLSTVLLGAVSASQAGVRFNFGINVPIPAPPGMIISSPARVYEPAPVVIVPPVCEQPAQVITPAPVCETPVVISPPQVVITPRPVVIEHRDYRPAHYAYNSHAYDRRDNRGRSSHDRWHR
jgi:hypothetical protein